MEATRLALRPLALAAMIAALILPSRAEAAGEITHAFMADEASTRVSDPNLRSFLQLHHQELLSGAAFPDTGYIAGGYGEVAHWEVFVDAYIDYLRNRPGCGDLADPLGPCAPQVAHAMGVAAHGMGDEVWDWLFEPAVTDHGEVPTHPFAPEPIAGMIDSIAYAMDMITLVDYFRWGESGLYAPPPNELTPVFAAAGHGQTTEADLASGLAGGVAILAAERAGAAADAERVRAQMPWSSSHFYGESGGVIDTAEAIAGYYDAVWSKLLDDSPPPPRVVGVHPEDGETGVPFDFIPARTSPGPDTGGAELRIVAVLSNAVAAETIGPRSFKLIDPSGRRVPSLEGFPRAGPYGADAGTHTLMFYPAEDLEPCTTYTAVATRRLRDMASLAINTGQRLERTTRWSFTTATPAGKACRRTRPPSCAGQPATLWTRSRGRTLRGTRGNDVIFTRAGANRIRGGAGDDLICAGRGRDRISGGRGADEIHAGAGGDRLTGGMGHDRLRGKAGKDRLAGGPGRDRCNGGTGGGDRARGCERTVGVP